MVSFKQEQDQVMHFEAEKILTEMNQDEEDRPMISTTGAPALDLKCIHDPQNKYLDEDESFRRDSPDSRASSKMTVRFSDLAMTEDYQVQWVADEEVSICMCCQKTNFSFYKRRHHCRACGNVICSTCSGARVPIKGLSGLQRICDECEYNMARVERNSLLKLSKSIQEEDMEMDTNRENIGSMDGQASDTSSPLPEDQPQLSNQDEEEHEEQEKARSFFSMTHTPMGEKAKYYAHFCPPETPEGQGPEESDDLSFHGNQQQGLSDDTEDEKQTFMQEHIKETQQQHVSMSEYASALAEQVVVNIMEQVLLQLSLVILAERKTSVEKMNLSAPVSEASFKDQPQDEAQALLKIPEQQRPSEEQIVRPLENESSYAARPVMAVTSAPETNKAVASNDDLEQLENAFREENNHHCEPSAQLDEQYTGILSPTMCCGACSIM